MLVQDVSRPNLLCARSRVGNGVGGERRGESIDELGDFAVTGGVPGGAPEARETRDVLTQGVAGNEATLAVPAAHVEAGRRKPGVMPVDLEQPVVVEPEVMGVDEVVLRLQRSAGELDAAVGEVPQAHVRDP